MADSSDISARTNDDEWVRAVIARALLADSEPDEPGAPPGLSDAGVGAPITPPEPRVSEAPLRSADNDWLTARPLDTASIQARAAANTERARRIAEANKPGANSNGVNGLGVQTAPTPQPVARTVPPAATRGGVAPLSPTTAAATSTVPPARAETPVTSQPVAPVEPPVAAPTAPLTPVEPEVDDQPQVAQVETPIPQVATPTAAPVEPQLRAEPAAPVSTPASPVLPPSQEAPATTTTTTTTVNGAAPTVDVPKHLTEPPQAAQTTLAAPTQAPGARRQDQIIEPARVDHGFSVTGTDGPLPNSQLVDDVMVEADVSTDGFRASDLRTILEWLAVIGSALAVALLIKAFVLQAFWIPSESMETTVNRGDRILVNKVSYRLHEVRRGDLVVFNKLEGTAGTDDLIKRAIALPGETIEVRDDGRIWIWGPGEGPEDALLLDEPYLNPGNSLLPAPSASDPVGQDIWDERCTNARTPGRCTLDDSSFFMLGDNRVRSSDSRFFGPVPDENVVGRAFVRIWPLGDISTL